MQHNYCESQWPFAHFLSLFVRVKINLILNKDIYETGLHFENELFQTLSVSCPGVAVWSPLSSNMLSFLRRTLGRRSIRKHAEKTRLREAQRATTHIPASGDAKSVITCRVSLLDGTDVSVDLPVRALCVLTCVKQCLLIVTGCLPQPKHCNKKTQHGNT